MDRSFAQDLPVNGQFFFNPALINPSMIGVDGQPSVYLSHHKQWLGFPGAPQTSQFSVQTPTDGGLSLSVGFQADQRGLVKTSRFLLGGSYNIPVKKGTYMRFGLTAGGLNNRTDIDLLRFSNNPSDQALSSIVRQDIQLSGSAGISYHTPYFHFGLALPNLFQPDYLVTSPFAVTPLRPLQQIVVHGSYRMYFGDGDRHLLEPYLNYRIFSGLPSQLEAAAVVHLGGLLWAGASYRQGLGPSALAGFKPGGKLAVGYSYAPGGIGESAIKQASHEIQLGLLFGTPRKKLPVYSFVNAEKARKKTSANQLARNKKPAPKKKTPQNTAVARNSKKTKTKPAAKPVVAARPVTKPTTPTVTPEKPVVTAPANTIPVAGSQSVNTSQGVPKSIVLTGSDKENQPLTYNVLTQPAGGTLTGSGSNLTYTPRPDFSGSDSFTFQVSDGKSSSAPASVSITVKAKTEETLVPTGLDELDTEEGEDADARHGTSHIEDLKEESQRMSRLDDHKENPRELHTGEPARDADRHETVARGNHQEEIGVGNFVIVGIFKSKANAEKYASGLKSMGITGIDYSFLSERQVWYVHFNETGSLDEAKSLRDRERKFKIFRDAWLLTVQ